jgi:hypothetical protein
MSLGDRLGLGIALLALGWGVGCGEGDTPSGFASDVSTTQIVSTNVGGKNVYIPSTVVVTSGAPQKLSVYNTTDTPHGFRIDALDLEVILPPQEELIFELPPLEAGSVLRIHCHLHPAHRTATLVVLPGD